MNPKVTVYIPSHNYGEFVAEAINSVLNQTMDDWELILINDGSSDNTQEIFETYSGFPKVRTYSTGGIGLPKVNNFALDKANGKYIVRLDGDDIFDENILLVLSNYLDHNDRLALVFPDYYLMDESGRIFSHERRRKLQSEDFIKDEPPNGACTMIRVDVLKAVGTYREDQGAQDGLDIWLKIKDKYDTTNVNLPLFFYRRHGKNLTDQPLRIVNARRNIKQDMAGEKKEKKKPCIAIIPCRRGYDFVDNLWKRKIGDKTLLERDIETCLSSDYFDYVVVTSDTNEVMDTIEKYEHDTRLNYFPRSTTLTSVSMPIVETMKEIVERYDPHKSGLVLLRYLQTPFVNRGTLEEAINTMLVSNADSAFSIEQIRHEIFQRGVNGLEALNTAASGYLSSKTLYKDAATCVAVSSDAVSKGSIRGANSVGFTVSSAEAFFVRNELDLNIAQFIGNE